MNDFSVYVHISPSNKYYIGAWVERKKSGKGGAWNKGLKLKDTGMLDNFIKAGRENAKRESRAVYQLSLDGDIIQKYDSVTSAARAVNVSPSCIFGVLAGRRYTVKGYKWEYVNG